MVNYAKENILSEQELYVFNTYYGKEKTQQEIANELGIRQVNISRYYRRACNKIKDYLLKNEVDQYFF